MNRISHKQAIQWIDRRLDGLLTTKQLTLLAEHLRSCDACRTYAAEMDLLPARLQGEFHARWDEKPGPSATIMQHVTTKARMIPMKNRISSSIKLFAGAMTLVVLGLAINFVISQLRATPVATNETEMANVLPRAEDRLLAFASYQNGNHDIYTMHADGSELTNLTNDPAYDGSPFWSPDGKRIAFVSDRSGSSQIYLMDPDGSNVTPLTSEAGDAHFDTNGHSAWSLDGRKLVFSYRSEGEKDWQLYSMDADGNNKTLLTHEPGVYLGPAWSPDGEHIAFAYYGSEARPLARRLFIVDKNGKNLTELTESLRIDQTSTFLGLDYYWSPEGTSVFFTAASTVTQETTYAVYEARLDGALIDITEVKTGKFVVDWWDETLLQEEENARTWTWIRSDGTRSALDICRNTDRALGIAYKRSEHGNLVFGANCSTTGWQLYWANPDGSTTNQLLSAGIPARNDALFNILWSRDDRFVAFVSLDSDAPDPTSTLYVLDVEQARTDPATPPLKLEASSDPSWQPVIAESVVEQEPTPKPEPISSKGRLLAFMSEQNGNIDIYTMDANGSALTNLTNNPAQDISPFWSPDGSRIAFESDRLGSLQIYLMAPDGSGVAQLTEGEADHEIGTKYGMNSSPWSPDGSKLIFSQRPPTATVWTLHVMEANGENHQSLVSEPDVYSFPTWSPDGRQIAFLAGDATNPAGPRLYVVNADGSHLIDVTGYLPENESLWAYNGYYWSQDAGSIFFTTWRQAGEGQDRWIAYEFRPATNELIEKAAASTAMGDWWKGTSLLTGFADDRNAPITWLRSDGTSSTLKPFERCEPADEYGFTYQRSARGNLMVAAHCPGEGWWLYWANPDGTLIQPLLDAPIAAEDFSFSSLAWSSDDKYITFNIPSNNLAELYLLDVEVALNDPAAQPVKVTTSARMPFHNSSWQPVANSGTIAEQPTPAPEQTSAKSGPIAVTCAGEYGKLDICTAHPDGQGLINLTNNPAEDTNPFWSPDGEQIAFESDRSGISQIYLMDADGSNIIQLTTDEAAHYLPVNMDGITYPWSPDGSKILILQDDPGEQVWTLISHNINEGTTTPLVTGQLYSSGISWSPDGESVGYLLDTSPDSPPLEPGIHVIDTNGNNPRDLKEIVPHTERLDSRYRWSSDGGSILFTTTRSDPSKGTAATIIYEYEISNNTLHPGDNLKEMGDWEEAQYLVTEFRTSKTSELISVWQHPDGNGNLLDVDADCSEFNISKSPLGNFAIAAACPDNQLRLYWANSDGTLTKQLFDLSLYTKDFRTSQIVWSPDDKYITFNVAGADNLTNMYVVNVEAILNNEPLATLHEVLSDGTEIYATNNPVQITLGGGSTSKYGAPSWQPVP